MILIVFIGTFLVVAVGGLAYDAGVRVERRQASRANHANALTDSMFCSCGGEWDKWQRIETGRRPVDARFPLTSGTVETSVQMRYCTSCNRADRRVL